MKPTLLAEIPPLRLLLILDNLAGHQTPPLKSLRYKAHQGRTRWQQRSPAMAAGWTDHRWTVRKLLTMVAVLTLTSD